MVGAHVLKQISLNWKTSIITDFFLSWVKVTWGTIIAAACAWRAKSSPSRVAKVKKIVQYSLRMN